MRNLIEKIFHSIYKIGAHTAGESCLTNFDLFFLLTKMTLYEKCVAYETKHHFWSLQQTYAQSYDSDPSSS